MGCFFIKVLFTSDCQVLESANLFFPGAPHAHTHISSLMLVLAFQLSFTCTVYAAPPGAVTYAITVGTPPTYLPTASFTNPNGTDTVASVTIYQEEWRTIGGVTKFWPTGTSWTLSPVGTGVTSFTPPGNTATPATAFSPNRFRARVDYTSGAFADYNSKNF